MQKNVLVIRRKCIERNCEACIPGQDFRKNLVAGNRKSPGYRAIAPTLCVHIQRHLAIRRIHRCDRRGWVWFRGSRSCRKLGRSSKRWDCLLLLSRSHYRYTRKRCQQKKYGYNQFKALVHILLFSFPDRLS